MNVAQKDRKDNVTIAIFIVGGLGRGGGFLGEQRCYARKRAQDCQDRNASPHIKPKFPI
jgi:hypothetical protein